MTPKINIQIRVNSSPLRLPLPLAPSPCGRERFTGRTIFYLCFRVYVKIINIAET
jgi:hypothetical protein